MKVEQTDRGFRKVTHPMYVEPHTPCRLVQESSAIGDYDDSMDRPGSSFLWVGEHHHLDRDEVQELVSILQIWLNSGRFPILEEGETG